MYLLMNKDNVVAVIKTSTDLGVTTYDLVKVSGQLPYGFSNINAWLQGRQASKHRKHIRA